MKNLKSFWIVILLLAGFFFAYFVKCQLDICLIKNFPLDKFPPLSLLQNRNPYHIIHNPQADVNLLSDQFAFVPGVKIWNSLWMREEGMVTGTKGHGNSSSWIITSRSIKDWALGHKKLIEVSPGEVYSFSGWMKTSDAQATGTFSVVLYEAEMQVKQWNFAAKSVSGDNNWHEVEGRFIVPNGIKYIRFQLTGRGIGKTWFDGIEFKKEKSFISPEVVNNIH